MHVANVKYTIEFDVSSEVPLEQLAKEILPLLKAKGSRLFLEPNGPAGGNTQVLVFTVHQEDKDRVIQYTRDHYLPYYDVERNVTVFNGSDPDYHHAPMKDTKDIKIDFGEPGTMASMLYDDE